MAWYDKGTRYGFAATLLALPALPACAANPEQNAVTGRGLSCQFSGMTGPVSPDEICARFIDAVEKSGRADIARIEVEGRTVTSAGVIAFDDAGEVVAELDYNVMDAELRSSTWQNFADGFARFLADPA